MNGPLLQFSCAIFQLKCLNFNWASFILKIHVGKFALKCKFLLNWPLVYLKDKYSEKQQLLILTIDNQKWQRFKFMCLPSTTFPGQKQIWFIFAKQMEEWKFKCKS